MELRAAAAGFFHCRRARAELDPGAARSRACSISTEICRTRSPPRFTPATTVYLRRDFQTALAALYAGQKVELIGMSPEGYLLKTNYRNNTITGWIKPEDLPSGIDPGALRAGARKTRRIAMPWPWRSRTRT